MKPIHPIFAPAFYSADRDLLLQLGFDPDRPLESHERNVLGVYEHHYDEKPDVAFRVTVSVEPYPAQFWQFDVEPITTDAKPVRISTGSGSLSEYWPAVMMIAEGMLSVTPLSEARAGDA